MIDLTGIKIPMMHEKEFPWFVKSIQHAIENDTDGVFVEIGAAKGKSFASILQILNRLGVRRKVYSIDPRGIMDGFWTQYLEKFGHGMPAEYLQGLSQNADVVEKVTEPIAWLFVDGCHCYECVHTDIYLWAPKVTTNGVMVFHDTLVSGKRKPCLRDEGKCRLWGVTPAITVSKAMKEFEELFSAEGNERGNLVGLKAYIRRKE